MARHSSGFHLRSRAGSPFWYVRATLPGGKRWEESTGVPRAGDREAATRRGAGLYVEALARAGVRAPISAAVAEQLDLYDLVGQYLAREEESYRGNDGRHVGRIRTDLKLYVLHRWKRIEEITADAWLSARKELHKDEKGPLGSRSIAHLANTLRHFLRWAKGLGFIAAMPEIESPKAKKQRAEQAERASLDAGQRDRLLSALRGMGEHRASRIYTALFYSLLRKGELAALTLRWVSFRDREIRIPAEHTKSGEPETIPLHPMVARAIRGELKERESIEPDEAVFGTFDFHQANDKKRQGGIFGRACLRAKLAKLKPDGTVDFRGLTAHHVTRHSSATIAAGRRGTTLEELMALGRWKDAQIPSRYLHPTVKAGRRASRRL
jgi:integrase